MGIESRPALGLVCSNVNAYLAQQRIAIYSCSLGGLKGDRARLTSSTHGEALDCERNRSGLNPTAQHGLFSEHSHLSKVDAYAIARLP
jgi:hypothetical protein